MNSATWMLKYLVAGPMTQKLLILSSHMALLPWSKLTPQETTKPDALKWV
jgi:hypothetical protein